MHLLFKLQNVPLCSIVLALLKAVDVKAPFHFVQFLVLKAVGSPFSPGLVTVMWLLRSV